MYSHRERFLDVRSLNTEDLQGSMLLGPRDLEECHAKSAQGTREVYESTDFSLYNSVNTYHQYKHAAESVNTRSTNLVLREAVVAIGVCIINGLEIDRHALLKAALNTHRRQRC